MSHQALKMEADNSSVPTLDERAEAVKDYIREDDPVQETQDTQEDRPEWLDPKFKSAEEMAKAYGELESKLGQQTEEADEEVSEEVSEEVTQDTESEEVIEGETPAQQAAISKATEDFFNTGEITEESYEELSKAGISKEIVDEYKANYQAAQELNELKMNMTANKIKESVGGEENYQQMTKWAKGNISDEEQKSYNDAVESGDIGLINLAVSGLYSKYSESNSIPPSQQLKGMSAPSSPQGFSNSREMSQSMQDPRYGNDAAYTKSIRDRVAASNW